MAVRGDPHFEPARVTGGTYIYHARASLTINREAVSLRARCFWLYSGRRAPSQAPGAPGPCTVISMRRFLARFAGVSFGATGCVYPNPLAEMMFGLTPCATR